MNRPLLCLIEDDPIMGESLADRFGLEGFDLEWHRTGDAALHALERRPYATVISDIRLPDISGEELFGHVVQKQAWVPPFVFITAFGSVERAVALLKMGAADYITKPFDIGELVDKVRTLAGRTHVDARDTSVPVLGVSPAARKVTDSLERIASRATSILITGESGVGKEVLARHIHGVAMELATQSSAPFVAVNCGALPETLIEAEFFGHEKGAFTGAERQKRGFCEQANGGTLFLDEIGDLPLLMQVKLLRAIQNRRVQRLGGEREVETAFRLVCATNRDLTELVKQGRFRDDLFYRINVVHLRIPALRERHQDILWLANRIVLEMSERLHEPVKSIHPSTQARLVAHPWPGNVRELRNRLERACIVTERSVLMPQDVFDETGGLSDAIIDMQGQTLEAYIAECERLYIEAAVRRFEGRMTDTARALGISRKNLWEKMKRHGLDAH